MDTDLNGTHSGFPEYNDDKVTENSGGVNANVLMEILGPALTVGEMRFDGRQRGWS